MRQQSERADSGVHAAETASASSPEASRARGPADNVLHSGTLGTALPHSPKSVGFLPKHMQKHGHCASPRLATSTKTPKKPSHLSIPSLLPPWVEDHLEALKTSSVRYNRALAAALASELHQQMVLSRLQARESDLEAQAQQEADLLYEQGKTKKQNVLALFSNTDNWTSTPREWKPADHAAAAKIQVAWRAWRRRRVQRDTRALIGSAAMWMGLVDGVRARTASYILRSSMSRRRRAAVAAGGFGSSADRGLAGPEPGKGPGAAAAAAGAEGLASSLSVQSRLVRREVEDGRLPAAAHGGPGHEEPGPHGGSRLKVGSGGQGELAGAAGGARAEAGAKGRAGAGAQAEGVAGLEPGAAGKQAALVAGAVAGDTGTGGPGAEAEAVAGAAAGARAVGAGVEDGQAASLPGLECNGGPGGRAVGGSAGEGTGALARGAGGRGSGADHTAGGGAERGGGGGGPCAAAAAAAAAGPSRS